MERLEKARPPAVKPRFANNLLRPPESVIQSPPNQITQTTMTTGTQIEKGHTSRATTLEKANVIEIDVSKKTAQEIASITIAIGEELFKIAGSKTIKMDSTSHTTVIEIIEMTKGSFECVAQELGDIVSHIRDQMGLPVRFFKKDISDSEEMFENPRV